MDDSVKEIITDFNILNTATSIKYIPACKECELKYICAGGCRIDNYLSNGSMIIPMCDENYKEKKYRSLIAEYLRGLTNSTEKNI